MFSSKHRQKKNQECDFSFSLLLLMLMPHKKSSTKSSFTNLLQNLVLLHVIDSLYIPLLLGICQNTSKFPLHIHNTMDHASKDDS